MAAQRFLFLLHSFAKSSIFFSGSSFCGLKSVPESVVNVIHCQKVILSRKNCIYLRKAKYE